MARRHPTTADCTVSGLAVCLSVDGLMRSGLECLLQEAANRDYRLCFLPHHFQLPPVPRTSNGDCSTLIEAFARDLWTCRTTLTRVRRRPARRRVRRP